MAAIAPPNQSCRRSALVPDGFTGAPAHTTRGLWRYSNRLKITRRTPGRLLFTGNCTFYFKFQPLRPKSPEVMPAFRAPAGFFQGYKASGQCGSTINTHVGAIRDMTQ